MINIIKPGIPQKKYKVIYELECKQCGCVFECESEDFKKNLAKYMVEIACPCCNTILVRHMDEVSQKRKEI